MLEFRLLGPVELVVDGESVALGPAKRRAVLAALAVDAGRPVPVETLIDRLWGAQPPPEARNTLYSHVARIRRLLTEVANGRGVAAAVVRRSGAYQLDVDPGRVDLLRARRLLERARGTSDPKERVGLLHEALDLWRGDALADIPGEWAERVRDRVQEQRLAALVLWGNLEQELGDPEVVLERVADAVERHPLAEPLIAVQLRALYQAGRTAEALNAYAATRRRLADELGAEPGAELYALHNALLRGELNQAHSGAAERPPVQPVPQQLPGDVPLFVGRHAAIEALDRNLATGGRGGQVAIVAAVSGTAGVGKTALAVHWAHRVRDQFPDGVLYLNLRTFEPSAPPPGPGEAIRSLLYGLQVPPHAIPPDVEAQVGMYRSLLADRRMLVVLDNARDAAQVRPLLPGAPGCHTLVTSRNDLSGLVATHGADQVVLGLLSAAEARDLLARRLGPDRVAAEPEAVREIIARCAGLPLALSIVAARAAGRPDSPLAALADRLRSDHGRRTLLGSNDPATNVWGVFAWSYRALGPAAGRLFRLLGLHPGPHIGTTAAASLAAMPVSRVRPLLADLVAAHLLTEPTPGRYSFHDLLRAYASELVHEVDTLEEQTAATRRLVDHYLHAAVAAEQLFDPYRQPIALGAAAPGVTPDVPADLRQALAWCAAEQRVLVAMVAEAARAGMDVHAWQLGLSITTYLDRQGYWHDWVAVQRVGLDAARRLGDKLAELRCHRGLLGAHERLLEYDVAAAHGRRALDLAGELGNAYWQGHSLLALAELSYRLKDHRDALRQSGQALERYRAAGHRPGEGNALNAIGWCHSLLGEYPAALENCIQALAVQEELGDRPAQAHTLDSLGHIYHHLGDHDRAVSCCRRAADLFRDLGDRYNEAEVLVHLGDAHDGMGDTAEACAAWREAMNLLDELGHPGAGSLRRKLDAAAAATVGQF